MAELQGGFGHVLATPVYTTTCGLHRCGGETRESQINAGKNTQKSPLTLIHNVLNTPVFLYILIFSDFSRDYRCPPFLNPSTCLPLVS